MSKINFYNAETKQWEIHNGEPSDLRFADVKREPTFSVVSAESKEGRRLYNKKIQSYTKYDPMTESKKRAIKAFYSPIILERKTLGSMSEAQYDGLDSLIKSYIPDTYIIDSTPPFHVVERSKLRRYLNKFKEFIFSLIKRK